MFSDVGIDFSISHEQIEKHRILATQFRTTLNCNNFKTTQKDVSLTSNKVKSTFVKALQMHHPRIKQTLRMQLEKIQIPSSNNKI